MRYLIKLKGSMKSPTLGGSRFPNRGKLCAVFRGWWIPVVFHLYSFLPKVQKSRQSTYCPSFSFNYVYFKYHFIIVFIKFVSLFFKKQFERIVTRNKILVNQINLTSRIWSELWFIYLPIILHFIIVFIFFSPKKTTGFLKAYSSFFMYLMAYHWFSCVFSVS